MSTTNKKLDKADLAILGCLYEDARMANKAIAEKVGLAPSSCLERMKRLQADGIITGTGVMVDFSALGGNIQAMVAVRLNSHDRNTIASFQSELIKATEVISVYHLGGENDFMLHVSVPDALHLRDFVFDKVTARPSVNHVETALIYDYQSSSSLPAF